MIPAPVTSGTSPMPLDLKATLPFPQTPWNISYNLFQRLRIQQTDKPFKAIEIGDSDPEFNFVQKYFFDQKPSGFGIRRVMCIHNPDQTQVFEGTVKSIEREANNPFFAPQWQNRDLKEERIKAIHRWKKQVEQFSPLAIPSGARGEDIFKEAKVLPLWHGSTQEKCNSIYSSGFTYFGKQEYSAGHKGGSTDKGYFGSGIYFTNSARYAVMYATLQGTGYLILTWVSMREPYPVVSDVPKGRECKDKERLTGQKHYQNYNAHYVPVTSDDPTNPDCMNYYPCYQDQQPAWDEFVVFEKAQTLPRFQVELCVDGPLALSIPHPQKSKEEELQLKIKQLEAKTESLLQMKTQSHASPAPLVSPPHLSMPAIKPLPAPTIAAMSSITAIRCITTLKEHSEAVSTLTALSGGNLASGSTDKTIKLWDISSGKCLKTLKEHSGYVWVLTALSGGNLASGSEDETIKLWDISSGKCLKTLKGHSGKVSALAALAGDIFVSGSQDHTIKLWDSSSGKCLKTLEGHGSDINALIALAGGIFASGSEDETIKLWDASSGKCLKTLDSSRVCDLIALGDGTLASGSRGPIKLWDISSDKCVKTLEGHSAAVYALTELTNGILASGSLDKTIKLWDISSGKCLKTLKEHSNYVGALTVLADGTLASGSSDKTIKLWK